MFSETEIKEQAVEQRRTRKDGDERSDSRRKNQELSSSGRSETE